MIKGESEYIEDYKRAQYKLPDSDNLGALWAPDFDPENYPGLDRLAGLELYLTELSKYSKKLSKAAYLRQRHFDLFLKDRTDRAPEDDGHRYWRLGMNQVAADAANTLAYWTKIRDGMLSKAISDYVSRPIVESLPFDPSTRNVDVAYRPADKKSIPRIVRMKASVSQKKMRQKFTKKAIAVRKAAESKLLESASADYVKQNKSFNYVDMVIEPLREKKIGMTWDEVSEMIKNYESSSSSLIFSPSKIIWDKKGIHKVVDQLADIYVSYMCIPEDHVIETDAMNALINIGNVLGSLHTCPGFFASVWIQTCLQLQYYEKEPYIGDRMFFVMANFINIQVVESPTDNYDSFMSSLDYIITEFGGPEKWTKFYNALDMAYPIYKEMCCIASVNTIAIQTMSKSEAILVINRNNLKSAKFKPVIPKKFANNLKYVKYIKDYAWFHNRSKDKLFYIATH